MSYEEMEYINELTRERREQKCRQAQMKDMMIRWGGWLLAGLMMAINLAIAVH